MENLRRIRRKKPPAREVRDVEMDLLQKESSEDPSDSHPDLDGQSSKASTGLTSSPPSSQSPPSFRIMMGAFLVLELPFVVLSGSACWHPILLPSSLDDHVDVVKGGFTIAVVVWQTLARFCLTSLITTVFSSEWHILFGRSNKLDPERTDRVSTLTSGIWRRARYACSWNATMSFRAAFLAWLALLALASIAPGALTVGIRTARTPLQLTIGNVSPKEDLWGSPPNAYFAQEASERAAPIVRLEQAEGARFGFGDSSNCVFGWPTQNVSGWVANYPSDAVCFAHRCRWEAPIFSEALVGSPVLENVLSLASMPNLTWAPWYTEDEVEGLGNISYTDGVWPLLGSRGANTSFPTCVVLSDDGDPADEECAPSTSAFIFLGTNSSFPNSTAVIDLGDLPSAVNKTGWIIGGESATKLPNFGPPANVDPPLASVLVCDPQLQLRPASIALQSDGSIQVQQAPSDAMFLNNAPLDQARIVTSQSLTVAMAETSGTDSVLGLAFLANDLFFDGQFNDTLGQSSPVMQPSSLGILSSKMDSYIASAAKAYMDGYRTVGIDSTIMVQASRQVTRTSIVTSVEFWVPTIVLIVVSASTAEQGSEGAPEESIGNVLSAEELREAIRAFDINEGFLITPPPLSRLPPGPWQAWEEAWNKTDGLRPGQGEARSPQAAEWRSMIRDRLPTINMADLPRTLPVLRRAHTLLAFLTHAYVHSGEPTKEGEDVVVPKTLAMLFCATAELLEVPPVISYNNAIITNWRLKDPGGGITQENVEMPMLFTRTKSEEHFWRTPLVVEGLSPAVLALIERGIVSLDSGENRAGFLATCFADLAPLIDRLASAIDSVRTACEPQHFYWELRPWMTGGKWTWEGVGAKDGGASSKDGWMVTDLGGATAGQSSVFPAIDIFLGIDHRTRPHEAKKPTVAPALPSEGTSSNATEVAAIPAESPETTSGQLEDPEKEQTFMERMAPYMPLKDRIYLSRLSAAVALPPPSIDTMTSTLFPHLVASSHRIRELVLSSPDDSPLKTRYDACIRSLEGLRKVHSRIALYYIISQSRVEPPEGSAYLSDWQEKMRADERRREERREGGEEMTGTGGMPLAAFLKRARQRTVEALTGNNGI